MFIEHPSLKNASSFRSAKRQTIHEITQTNTNFAFIRVISCGFVDRTCLPFLEDRYPFIALLKELDDSCTVFHKPFAPDGAKPGRISRRFRRITDHEIKRPRRDFAETAVAIKRDGNADRG